MSLVCGGQVLSLLAEAWRRRLTFTIGTSVTTGETDTVVWNEIHHKTSISNDRGHGYPDHNYLDNVVAELAAQGVEDNWSTLATHFIGVLTRNVLAYEVCLLAVLFWKYLLLCLVLCQHVCIFKSHYGTAWHRKSWIYTILAINMSLTLEHTFWTINWWTAWPASYGLLDISRTDQLAHWCQLVDKLYRVATCLEILEMSGNLAAVGEISLKKFVLANCPLHSSSLGLHQCLVGCCRPCITLLKGYFTLY